MLRVVFDEATVAIRDWFDRFAFPGRSKIGCRRRSARSSNTVLEALEKRLLPTVTFSVTFNDPGATQAAYYLAIESNVVAAGSVWSNYLDSDASIEVEVSFSSQVSTANGGSETVVFVRDEAGIAVYQDGTASEIRTGVDPNGTQPDLLITIGVNYLHSELWLDPTPYDHSDPVPLDQTDGLSVMMHEIAHGLGFIGYGSGLNGELPADYATLFDQLVTFTDGNLFFTGSAAVNTYGGPVPLTFGNHFHVGNSAPRPGSELQTDLMNGVVFYRGTRMFPSELNLAMLQDLEVPLLTGAFENRPPEVADQTVNALTGGEPGDEVGTILATDPDVRQSLTFTIVSGNEAGIFALSATTGVLTVLHPELLDPELTPQFSLIVTVTDSGEPPLTTTAQITVQVSELTIPAVITTGGQSVLSKGSVVVIDPAATLVSAENLESFESSRLVVEIEAGAQGRDTLVISGAEARSRKLKLRRGELRLGKAVVGRLQNPSNGRLLNIELTAQADADVVRLLLRSVALKTSRKASGLRTITLQFVLPNDRAVEPATRLVSVPGSPQDSGIVRVAHDAC